MKTILLSCLTILFFTVNLQAQGWKDKLKKATTTKKPTTTKQTTTGYTAPKSESKGGENDIPSNAEKTINFSTSKDVSVVKAAETATFNDGDIIYAMTNFGGPIQKQFNYLIPTLIIWIDDELIFMNPLTQLMSSQESSILVQIFPDPSTWDGQFSLSILNNALSTIGPGDHKMTVGWTASGGSTKSLLGWYGEIILKAGDLKKWGANAGKINAANLAKVELPKAVKSDPALEAKMVALTNQYAQANGWDEKFSKAVIRSNWRTQRNSLTGIVLSRSCSAVLCATWPDGHCSYQTIGFKQDYDGSNYSSSLTWDGVGYQQDILCEKIK